MAKRNNQTYEYEKDVKPLVKNYLEGTSFNDDAQEMIKFLYDTLDGQLSENDLMECIQASKKTGRKPNGTNKEDKRNTRISKIQSEANRRLRTYGVKIGNTKDKMGRCFKKIPGFDSTNPDINDLTLAGDQGKINPSNKQVIERCLLILCMRYGLLSSQTNSVLSEKQTPMSLEEITKLLLVLDEKNVRWSVDLSKEERESRIEHVKRVIYKQNPCVGNMNMIERGYIRDASTPGSSVKEQNYELSQKAFHILLIDRMDWFKKLRPLICSIGKTSSFSGVLQECTRQLDSFLSPFDLKDTRRFETFGIGQGDSEGIRERINEYSKHNYKGNVLEITFSDPETADKRTCKIKTGLLVYSRDKDKLFLIGRDVDTNKSIKIDDSDVIEIKGTEMVNDVYGSDYFEKMFETMFVASVEPEYKVELHFKDFGNIRGKVERLKKSRLRKPTKSMESTNPKIDIIPEDEEDEKELPEVDTIPEDEVDEKERECFRRFDDDEFKVIRYRDHVSGLEDFAKYLRGFGSSVIVVKPEELKKRMLESIDRSIEAYAEEGYIE